MAATHLVGGRPRATRLDPDRALGLTRNRPGSSRGCGDRLLLSHDLATDFGVFGTWQDFKAEGLAEFLEVR